jgi:hypothetical protein
MPNRFIFVIRLIATVRDTKEKVEVHKGGIMVVLLEV